MTPIENDLIDLSQGSYWRPLQDIPVPDLVHNWRCDEDEAIIIPTGQVLLLQSIRDVDNSAHTIILRPHPSIYGKTVYLAAEYREGKPYSWKQSQLTQYRFLVTEFLLKFELVTDADAVRAKELAAAQDRIRELQQHLLNGQSNPEVLRPVLALGIKEWETEKELDPEQAEYIATMATTTALVPTLTESHVDNLKLRVEREHKLATIRAGWIKDRVEEVGEAVKALMPYMEEQAAAALSHTEDVIRKVKSIQKGIESLDLYIGKDLVVETLKTGTSAPAGQPLSIGQRKLFMQEEFSVWADVNDEFDFHSESEFLKALAENESLQNQLFPGDRAIICMATRRHDKDYRDPWINQAKNQINKEVFLLIRDGENLHRVFSPVESHLRSIRLFPSRNEVDGIFSGVDGSNINFQDTRYTDKLEEHEAVALHYKRFLILLAGLDHRLNLFGPFYDGPKTTKFVSLEFQQAHFRFIHDSDGHGLLPQASRISLAAWLTQNNTYLRVGSRILANLHVLANPQTAPGMTKEHEKSSHGYYRTRFADNDYPIAVVSESQGELVLQIPTRSRRNYSGHPGATVNSRVSVSAYRHNYYRSGFAYLVLDAIKADELEWYINDRDSRIDHLEFIQLFKQTLVYLRVQEEQEAPARKALREALDAGHIGDPDKRGGLVDDAVRSWRATHRGAALPSVPSGKSWTELLDTMYTIEAKDFLRGQSMVFLADDARTHGWYTPLRLVVTGANKLALYAASQVKEQDNRITPHIWVHRFHLERIKTGGLKLIKKEWAVLPASSASETTLHEWPGTEDWTGKKSPFTSFEEKQHILQLVDRTAVESPWLRESLTPEEWQPLFEAWSEAYRKVNRNTNRVTQAQLQIPVGLSVDLDENTFRLLSVHDSTSAVRLWDLAPGDAERKQLEDRYAKEFYRTTGYENFKAMRQGPNSRNVGLVLTKNEKLFPSDGFEYSTLSTMKPGTYHNSYQDLSFSLDVRFKYAQAYYARYRTRHYDDERGKQPIEILYLGAPAAERGLDSLFEHYCEKFVIPVEKEIKEEDEDEDEDDEE